MSVVLGRIQNKDLALIFIHIPKTGGTTLDRVVKRHYSPQTICVLGRERAFEAATHFKTLSLQEKSYIRCLTGHIPFGLHQYLAQPATYVTMLREPIDRLISHYYYVKRSPKHYLYQQVTSANMDLADYISSGISSELNNGQVRLLSGVETVDTVFGHESVTSEILEIAKANLRQHFAWVGLCDRFDESLLLLKNSMGWKHIYYTRENVTFARPAKRDISRQTLQVIEKYNELDLELYEFTARMFKKQLQEQRIDQKKLAAFRSLNEIYGAPHNLLRRARRVARSLLGDFLIIRKVRQG